MALSVAGIVLRGGRLLVARRLPGGDLGGKWEFPGGKAEEGETAAEALVREFREEFGVEARPGPFLGRASFEHRGTRRTLEAWGADFSGDPELTEHSEWRWATLEEIEGLDFAGSDRKLLPALQAYADSQPRLP